MARSVEEKLWTPVYSETGEQETEVHQATIDSQLNEIKGNKSAKLTNRAMKAWGWSAAVAAGMAVLVASTLQPYIPAALVALKATVAVGNVIWPMGIGVMVYGQLKEWVNEFTRRKLLSKSTSSLFRSAKKAKASAAHAAPAPAH